MLNILKVLYGYGFIMFRERIRYNVVVAHSVTHIVLSEFVINNAFCNNCRILQ